MVLQINGHRFMLESPRGLRTLRSDQVTGDHRCGMRNGPWPLRPKPSLRLVTKVRRALNSFSNGFSTTVGMMKDNLRYWSNGSGFLKWMPRGNLPLLSLGRKFRYISCANVSSSPP